MSAAAVRLAPYRPEIQGTRAIAALLVATFHIWLGRVSGGVDVFFVMSGFLITVTLFGHFHRFDRIKPVLYVTRLLRRLLPAALTVLTAVLIGTWLFLPKVLWENTTREIIAATLFFENWQLASSAVDYLAQFGEHTVVQHFWAMSIQGQFYLIWLGLFLFVWLFSRTFGTNRKHVAGILFATLFVASLTYSIWLTMVNQPVAYFDTRARVWEFALGGLAAVYVPHLNLSRPVKLALGWAGLIGIVSCGLIFQVSTIFPGYAALWPTTSALLILAAGGSGSHLGADRFLSLKPLVWLGSISYGIYLWHWPILEFYREVFERPRVGWRGGLFVLGMSILLAWLTKILVEDPIQEERSASRWRPVVLAAATVFAVVGLISGSFFTGNYIRAAIEKNLAATNQLDAEGTPAGAPCFGAAALVAGSAACPQSINEEGVIPEPATTRLLDDSPCIEIERRDYIEACAFGAPAHDATKTILLVGDSHSMMWRVVVDELAQYRRWHAIAISAGGCLPAMTSRISSVDGLRERCLNWNREMIEWVNEHPEIDTLFTIAASGRMVESRYGRSSEESSVESYLEEWAAMKTINHIVVLRDSPRLTTNVLTCVEKSMRSARNPAVECRRPRDEALLFDPAVKAAESDKVRAKVGVVDLTDNFCDDEYCYPVIGNLLAYKDSGHLNRIFARTLAPYAIEQVDKLLPDHRSPGRQL